MNYYRALKHRETGLWAFCMNGMPVGYCRPYWEWWKAESMMVYREIYHENHPEVIKTIQFKDKHHDGGHATQEESEECYSQYLLDQRLRLGLLNNGFNQCAICGELTNKYAELDMTQYNLCDQHNNKESVEKLHKPSEIIISSY